jgi:acetate kinase
MRILVLNAGSTSLKFEVVEARSPGDRRVQSADLRGEFSGIGGATHFHTTADERSATSARPDLRDHASAIRAALEWLTSHDAFECDGVRAIAHRVVHGGPRLFDPVVISDRVLTELDAARDLAPLHNGPALDVIRAARALIRDVPMIAVFDTAYFRDLPDVARLYAIPQPVADRLGIRRFGFHGFAHRFMARRANALLSDDGSRRMITLQLGGGCSAAAILQGRPIDTSMGLTPLEGLVMATRCGDIDPAAVALLVRRSAMTPDEAETWLNRECGLLGVSGASGDMRELLRLETDGHAGASLAIRMFCSRVRKCVCAYMGVLGGADAIVFGGGIGEHSAEIRARICRGIEWCGVKVDEDKNRRADGREHRISTADSGVTVVVTPVREAEPIAADAAECLRNAGKAEAESPPPQIDRKEDR